VEVERRAADALDLRCRSSLICSLYLLARCMTVVLASNSHIMLKDATCFPRQPFASNLDIAMIEVPQHQIRAVYDEHKIRIYQAYKDSIADAALAAGTFAASSFSMNRMTWIKPSFLWMMHRAGWGYKDAGQRRILAIDITREGFDWALAHSCPSRPDPQMSKEEWARLKAVSPVRIQWDPERDLNLQPLPYRTIQIGIGGEAVLLYVGKWILAIADITDLAHTIHSLVESGQAGRARTMLPQERAYVQS